MTKGLAFWLVMLVALILGVIFNRTDWKSPASGMSLVVFVLLFLLGWSEFGFIIK